MPIKMDVEGGAAPKIRVESKRAVVAIIAIFAISAALIIMNLAGCAGIPADVNPAGAVVGNVGSMTQGPPMTRRRMCASSVLLDNGKVLIAAGDNLGGLPGLSPSPSDSELYDPAINAFTPGPAMTVSRRCFPTILLPSHKVLIAGGDFPGFFGTTLTADLYDPVANRFDHLGPMPMRASASMRCTVYATLLRNGTVLIFGCTERESATYIYDPSHNFYGAGPDAEDTVFSVLVLPDDKLLFIVSSDYRYHPTTDSYVGFGVAVFDPKTLQFTGVPNSPSSYLDPLLLPNGKVLLFGVPLLVLYDPVKNDVSRGPHLAHNANTQRILLGNGKVLIVSGDGVHLYDPATNTLVNGPGNLFHPVWALGPVMVDTATLLANGKVLITDTTGASEIYTPGD